MVAACSPPPADASVIICTASGRSARPTILLLGMAYPKTEPATLSVEPPVTIEVVGVLLLSYRATRFSIVSPFRVVILAFCLNLKMLKPVRLSWSSASCSNRGAIWYLETFGSSLIAVARKVSRSSSSCLISGWLSSAEIFNLTVYSPSTFHLKSGVLSLGHTAMPFGVT